MSRPTKVRRTRADIDRLRQTIAEQLEIDQPMTVRQVFYRLVTMGVIAKSESEYKQTVVRLLGRMRRDGMIPFGWISDSTRWMRKPQSFSSMQHCLRVSAQTYRRCIWNDLPEYVEVWLEKEALAGVLFEETAQWDVPLMVTRGYPSLSYIYEAAEAIAGHDKPAHLYYFGDHDPSGVDIPRSIRDTMRELAPDANIRLHRVAVTAEQIRELGLPTRPTKTTDSRQRNFEGESVEVDAIAPSMLRSMVRESINRHIDPAVLASTRHIEALERQTLQSIQLPGLGTVPDPDDEGMF